MKVLVVAHESEFIGGANRALFAILKYWKNSENIQFDVLAPDNQGDFVEALEKMNVDHYAIKYFKVFSELKGDYKDAFRKINVYRKDLYNYFAARKASNCSCFAWITSLIPASSNASNNSGISSSGSPEPL